MFERKAADMLDKWDEKANEVMTPAAKSCIISHSWYGAIVFILPLFGFETIIYAFILWDMYASLAKHMNRKFNIGAIVSGFIINLFICLVANLILDFLSVFIIGFILAGLAGYFCTYQSGRSYMGLLAGKKK